MTEVAAKLLLLTAAWLALWQMLAIVRLGLSAVAEARQDRMQRLERQVETSRGVIASLTVLNAAVLDKNKKLASELVLASHESSRLRMENLGLHATLSGMKVNQRLASWFAPGGREASFDRETVDALIKLCHPDRHPKNAEIANEMTKKLLEMRKQVRS
jgi:hypothetical protein